MNWKRIKTFLIVLFLIINVYLISTTSGIAILRVTPKTRVEKETVSKTVKVIESNYGVDISEDKIPTEFVNLSNIDVTNFVFTENFEKKDYGFVQTESGFECEFKTKTYSYTENIAKSEIISILSSLGIDQSIYKMKFKKSDHGLVCVISEYVSGYPIFDGRIYAEFTSSMIKMKGNWYLPQQTEVKQYESSERLHDITSVLIDCVSRVSGEKSEKYGIENIAYGYFVGYHDENVITKSASAIPCYMIETDFGYKYYYDAYNGKFLKQEG